MSKRSQHYFMIVSLLITGVSFFLITIAVVALSINSNDLSSSSIPVVASVAFAWFSVVAALVTSLTVLRNRPPIDISIAVAGPPRSGKTVFVNVLFQRLMEDDSLSWRFTADAKSAQSAFRTVSGIKQGRWPSPSSDGIIERYRGTIEYSNAFRSVLAIYVEIFDRLIGRRREVSLEIADSAGETWDSLSEAAENGSHSELKSLYESRFFQYVAESNALVFFIDAEMLTTDHLSSLESIRDLRATFQLLRSVRARQSRSLRYEAPIVVLVSKSDLLSAPEIACLEALKRDSYPESHEMSQVSTGFLEAYQELADTVRILHRQCSHFRLVLTSSLISADLPRPERSVRAQPSDSACDNGVLSESLTRPEQVVESILADVLR